MLFLVPFAAPVHASGNGSLPTLTMTPNAILAGGATTVAFTLANPATNAYAITSVTFIAPTGWSFATQTCGGLLGTAGAISSSAFQCTGSVPPGFSTNAISASITPVASPATSPAPTGVFTTSIIDASAPSQAYPGPTFTMYSVATGTTVASVTVPAGATTYVAGSAPITVTATLSTNQANVPIVFSYPSTYPQTTGGTASVSPSSSVTASGSTSATATTSFQPSDKATDNTGITATIGTSAISTTGPTITTVAASPALVGFYYSGPATAFGPGTTYYLSGAADFGIPAGATATMAKFAAAGGNAPLYVAVTDAFGNAISFGSITSPTITVASASGTGFNSGTSLYTSISCTTPVASAVSCTTGDISLNYFQGYTYGTVGQLTAIITGQYPGTTPFSVTGTSGNIVTSTQATAFPLSLSAAPNVGAGTAETITATPNAGTQPGVPVTFNLCGFQKSPTTCTSTTVGYSGSFVGGAQTGFVVDTSGTTGTAVASYNVDTTLNHVGTWNATAADPITGTPTNKLATATSATATTVAGTASNFKILVYFNSALTSPTTSGGVTALTPAGVAYVNVELVDAYGNLATNVGATNIQVNLAATTPTTLSVQTAYISFGNSQTAQTYGPIVWTVPSSVSLGTVLTLSASGVVNGVSVSPSLTVTVVSALPTLSVTSPMPVSGTIYASSTGVTFRGWANVSAGLDPLATHIASIGYKIGSSSWVQTAASGAQDNFILSIFMPVGLSTIQFNATDSTTAKNTAVSSVYNVLVDNQPPTFTFGATTTNTGCVSVTAATSQGDFNATSFSATWGGVAVAAGQITWTGTQTAGTAGGLTANICGLTSQTATLSVTGKTLAGLSGTASESLTVTVPFADSITFNTGTATYGLVGAFSGVTISVTNGWNTAQTIVVFATFKSGTSTYVAQGTVTLGAGATASVFAADLQSIPAGTYTVTFAAVTTSNQAVSAPTTPITVVAT